MCQKLVIKVEYNCIVLKEKTVLLTRKTQMFNYCVVRRLKKKILNNAKLQVRTKEKTLLWESRSF